MFRFNATDFNKDMRNLLNYTQGFIDGVERGKPVAMAKIGAIAVEAMKEFIDANARVNPQAMHHVYEWYQVGSPDARLFDISYVVSGIGISLNATFRQSQVIKSGSTPFYDKARIMEQGLPVTIIPKKANVLAFDDESGSTIFTKGPVNVSNPGGEEVRGSFERVFDLFVSQYFTQAFLSASGILAHFSNPSEYRTNLRKGLQSGKSAGISAGFKWITSVGGNL